MKLTKKGKIVTGYKATDKDMCCRGFQYELGQWYEHNKDLEMCVSGFHFCEYPSGPWAFYGDGRLFKVEAEYVHLSEGPGADLKHVAKRIRLVEEIEVGGIWNTGIWNTGDGNTGSRNTGSSNTGSSNTGSSNTGSWNTGDWNTGSRNTGDWNTGNWNTGSSNTGSRNTGSWNTGDGNTGDNHSGSLCWGEPVFYLFNKPANKDNVDFNLVDRLARLLMEDKKIDPAPFLGLPNATKTAIKKLHYEHKKARKVNK